MDTNKQLYGILFIFSNLRPIKHNIILTDGFPQPIFGKRVIHPTKSLSLASSHYVPDFPFNLLSTSQLTKSLHCSITFDPTSCVVHKIKSKKMICLGHGKDGLNYLDPDGSFSLTFSAMSVVVSPL